MERMSRRALNHFTKDMFSGFFHADLEALKKAIHMRRGVLTAPIRPKASLPPPLDQRVIEPVVEHAPRYAGRQRGVTSRLIVVSEVLRLLPCVVRWQCWR
jgi:hypothetical protein